MAGENHYATASRRKILEILKESKDKTVTAAQIGEQLRQMDSEVNITTIYRYLDRLEKDGTVIRYVSGQGSQAAYQYVEQGKGCCDPSAPSMCKMWSDLSSGLRLYERNLRTY